MVDTFGLPNLVSTRRLQSLVTQTRTELDLARVEAVTSRSADLGKRLGGDVGKVHKIEKQIADAEARTATISLLSTEFQIVQSSLETVRSSAADIATDTLAAVGLNDQIAIDAIEIKAEAELRLIVGTLNTGFGGRQMFSGAATDTPPISSVDTILTDVRNILNTAGSSAAVETLLDDYFDNPAGTFQTTIYQGSTTDAPTREVSETRRIGIDTKVTDPGIRDVIRGLAVMAQVGGSSIDPTQFDAVRTNAANTLNDGANAIVTRQSELGAAEAELNLLTTRTASLTLSYQTALNALVSVDQYEAASRMTALETQLQATYATTARLAQLNLVNYL